MKAFITIILALTLSASANTASDRTPYVKCNQGIPGAGSIPDGISYCVIYNVQPL